MILVVQVFNSPALSFKTEVFSVLANIAWTYLLHEHYDRKGVEIKDKDGWAVALSQMLDRIGDPASQIFACGPVQAPTSCPPFRG